MLQLSNYLVFRYDVYHSSLLLLPCLYSADFQSRRGKFCSFKTHCRQAIYPRYLRPYFDGRNGPPSHFVQLYLVELYEAAHENEPRLLCT